VVSGVIRPSCQAQLRVSDPDQVCPIAIHGLWTEILRCNATEVVEALAPVIAALTAASEALTPSDALREISDDLADLLARGNAGRAALTTRRTESARTSEANGDGFR
jgi:hypothetical protein